MTKITSSLIVASLLFSMTGCGDDDKKTPAQTETPTQNETINTAKKVVAQKAQLQNNLLSREIAKNPNLPFSTILATQLSNETTKIVSAREFILASGDEESITEMNSLSPEKFQEEFVIAYFESIEELTQASNSKSRETRGLFSSIKKTVKKAVNDVKDAGDKVVDGVKDKVIDPIKDKVIDPVVDTVKDKVIEPIKDKVIDPVVDTVKDKVIEPIKDKVIDPIVDTVKDKVIDPVKDKVVDALADSSLVKSLGNEAFKIMLKSGTATREALRFAITSEGMMKIMIEIMDEHWSLAEQMQPLLENDVDFGHLFMDLALSHPVTDADGVEHLPMAEFLFGRIDAGMYKSLTIAMTLSRNATNNGSAGKTTEVLSTLMARPEMAKFFEIPENLEYVDAQDNKAFSRLLFSNGKAYNDADLSTRADGSELANERFFYEMFATPESTANFITAMQGVEVNQRLVLMNQIFLGENEALGNDDNEQGYNNIYAITAGMAKGLGEGATNFVDYQDKFLGFAGLITEADYLDIAYSGGRYAIAFGSAGYNYFGDTESESSYGDDFATLIKGTELDADTNDTAAAWYSDMSEIVAGYIDDASKLDVVQEGLAYYNNVDLDALFYGQTKLQFFSNIDENNIERFTDINYTTKTLYGSTDTWDYIPNKFSEKDWLKENSTQNIIFNYSGGTVIAYVVSTKPLEVVREQTNMNFVTVALNGDAPLSSDLNANFNVYRVDMVIGTELDLEIFNASSISAVFFDADKAMPNVLSLRNSQVAKDLQK